MNTTEREDELRKTIIAIMERLKLEQLQQLYVKAKVLEKIK